MKYVAVSGGADSTALALLMHERGEEFEMVFADTGAELPETYYTLARLARERDAPRLADGRRSAVEGVAGTRRRTMCDLFVVRGTGDGLGKD